MRLRDKPLEGPVLIECGISSQPLVLRGGTYRTTGKAMRFVDVEA